MKRSLNPNLAAAILIGTTALILMILPISISIEPIPTSAQETASAGQTVEYTLHTVLGGQPPMAFVGVGGDIDSLMNPLLTANVGDTVIIHIVNNDPVLHDLTIDAFGVSSGQLTEAGQEATITFNPTAPGDYEFYCSVPGHKDIGMKGILRVAGEALVAQGQTGDHADMAMSPTTVPAAPASGEAVSVVRNPADVPPPVGDREPQNLHVELTAQEVTGYLADGTTFNFFTFDGQIPGPMLRIRTGDTVELHLKNADGSLFPHSIDLHAVTGPGGGAVYTQTNPGEQTFFIFKALNPGLYVYHCATASVAHHIANGMYGLILVEPEGGLPPVDREFYIMQGDVYTVQPYGTQGHLDFSYEKMLNEDPEYFTFNGAAGALTQDEFAPRANVGETVRLFFGVGGPNATSSFHVIGEIFDRVYNQAALTSAPMTDVQTTTVPPGGAVMVEFKLDVPGRYILVDHALSRLERGLAGFLYAEGEEDPAIFFGPAVTEGSGH